MESCVTAFRLTVLKTLKDNMLASVLLVCKHSCEKGSTKELQVLNEAEPINLATYKTVIHNMIALIVIRVASRLFMM